MRLTRRTMFAATAMLGLSRLSNEPAVAQTGPAFTLPMGWEGGIPGDGTIIRHAFDVENTSLYPG